MWASASAKMLSESVVLRGDLDEGSGVIGWRAYGDSDVQVEVRPFDLSTFDQWSDRSRTVGDPWSKVESTRDFVDHPMYPW